LYKGINFSLIQEIYNALYIKSLDQNSQLISLHTNSELQKVTHKSNNEIELLFYHSETDQLFTHNAGAVILATGYQYHIPEFINPIKNLIEWTVDPSLRSGQAQYQVSRNYSIDKANSLFVQNAELASHGFNTADLGMGPYRNATIINTILKYEHYKTETGISFQKFGVPASL
ncbi:MAG TPA: SidA/IucD/PvdA family monooxygenase, partial [Candidatus Brocadiaceae bacterium]